MKLKRKAEQFFWIIYLVSFFMISGIGSLGLSLESILMIVILIISNLISGYLLLKYGRVFNHES